VNREFGVTARLEDPDECVAKGAAIFALNEAYTSALAAYEDGEEGYEDRPSPILNKTRTVLVNVTSKTYGTDVSINGERCVQNLIFANASLPTQAVDRFSVSKDNQSAVSMNIYESDVTDEEKDRVILESSALLLEAHTMELPRACMKGTPIAVTFALDSEGMLSVHAEVEGNPPFDVKLHITGVRSDDELRKAAQRIDNMDIE
jgi:molecular chaperone DnaK (HSP70)